VLGYESGNPSHDEKILLTTNKKEFWVVSLS